MDVFEKCLVGGIDRQATTFVELSNGIVEQFGGGKGAQVPWITGVVSIFRIPPDSHSRAVWSSVVDWVDRSEAVDQDFVGG